MGDKIFSIFGNAIDNQNKERQYILKELSKSDGKLTLREIKELEKYLEKNGEKISSYSPKEISDLKWSLMVELSSYYYADQSRYILNTFRDSDVKKAIEEMSN